ncbi:SRPBCC family protein [Pinibacter soli]|uniref:SRPBCC family protein n=1 Tax=Pinibacter soli TaxID=3044211 RepID=A0ABT6RCB2_9BACT|nr:SRPBCC family protein [Pinibacter soli]MDI3320198.1 SRPBCC family protein [Pinibacter soli]
MNLVKEIIKTTADTEITTVRVVNAGNALAYKAWADPKHLKNWWGPNGFTNTFLEHDLQPGGKWKFTMHGPEGGNYENECVFIKVEEGKQLAWYRISKPLFQCLVTFEPVSEIKTKIVFKMLFDTKEECDKIRSFALEKNEENFDRLEREIEQMKVLA